MAVGEFYVVKQFTTYLGQNMLNQYFYEQVGESGETDAKGLWLAFDDDIMSTWSGTIGTGVDCPNVEVFQIAEGSDFHSEQPTNNQGTRVIVGAATLPSSVAFSYRSNRAGAGTRRSRKRFSGMDETDITGNALTALFLAITAVGDMATKLGAVIQQGANSNYKPIQIAAGWAVGFPPTKNFDVPTWDTAVLSTQNSRKP